MPLVGFRPTKARLIIEDSNDTVLVMKVVVADSESVEFSTGGKLDSLTGVLRIRERKEDEPQRNGSHVVGSLVYIAESGEGPERSPAKYRINIAMAPEKFRALLRVAVAGNLPNKFFVDAGERISKTETRGMTYWVGGGGRTKVWDSEAHRSLPITKFSMILPIDVGSRGEANRAPAAALPGPAPQVCTIRCRTTRWCRWSRSPPMRRWRSSSTTSSCSRARRATRSMR